MIMAEKISKKRKAISEVTTSSINKKAKKTAASKKEVSFDVANEKISVLEEEEAKSEAKGTIKFVVAISFYLIACYYSL